MNSMRKARVGLFGVSLMSLVLLWGVAGCGGVDDDDFSSGGTGSVELLSASPYVDSEGSFYASLAHLLGRTIGGSQRINLLSHVQIKNNTASRRTVFLQVYIPGYSEVGMERVELGGNETIVIPAVNVTYDYAALYDVTTPVSTSLQAAIYDGEKLIDYHSIPITIQPLTRYRWFISDGTQVDDMRPFVTVFVTPEDRGHEIQKLLTEAAQYTQDKAISGYQGQTLNSGIDQIRAVYNAIQARGMVYTSVPGSFFDGAQYVKVPAQSLRTNSANCIDGALVFASAFEAMGMESFLIFMSGHALVAVRAVKGDDTSIFYIETTMVGTATFMQAIESGRQTVQQRYDQQDPMLLPVDVNSYRMAGVTPVNL